MSNPIFHVEVEATASPTEVKVTVSNGPKGDPFRYEDFTPEQIEDLKQPAIDAAVVANNAADAANQAASDANEAAVDANNAAVNANTSAEGADLSTDAANNAAGSATSAATDATNAAESANQAATNANSAADSANQAADAANNAAGSATSAATDATNAAESANQAADHANTQRGWTPAHIDLEIDSEKTVRQLVAYFGGTGVPPTDNIGLYVGEGMYVEDVHDALNYKGTPGRPGVDAPTQFGTTAGTVAEGNDDRINNGQVAYEYLLSQGLI